MDGRRNGRARATARLLAALLLLLAPLPARALPLPDPAAPCVLELVLRDTGGAAVGGGRAAVRRVAEWETSGGAPRWRLAEAYRSCGLDPEELTGPDAAARLADYTARHAIAGQERKLDDGGAARFDALEPGLYLVTQTRRAAGYTAFSPFLIALPLFSGTLGDYLTSVTACPKVQIAGGGGGPAVPPGPDDPTPGDPIPDDPTPGDPIPGDPTPGDPIPGDPTPGDPIPGGPTPGDPIPGDPIPGDPIPGGPIPGDPPPEESGISLTSGRPGGPERLPQTGQLWWPVPVLIQLGLLLALAALLRRRDGRIRRACLLAGTAALAAALLLTAGNLRRSILAGREAEAAAVRLWAAIPAAPRTQQIPVLLPPTPETGEADLPRVELDGQEYLGLLSFPTLGMEVPVRLACTPEGLRTSPCRYAGGPGGGLVIAGHNFSTQFGRLGELSPGDAVELLFADGTLMLCRVDGAEILSPWQVEEMTDGAWDLTLFTCTPSGRERVCLRCRKQAAFAREGA